MKYSEEFVSTVQNLLAEIRDYLSQDAEGWTYDDYFEHSLDRINFLNFTLSPEFTKIFNKMPYKHMEKLWYKNFRASF